MFSGDIERNQWREMALKRQEIHLNLVSLSV